MGRLTLLVALLVLVAAMMQAARGPAFVDALDRVFGGGEDNANAPMQGDPQGGPQQADGEIAAPPSPDAALLASIEDNAPFLSEESDAWFHLWDILQEATPEQMARESGGEATYVQLVEQPAAYRGKVVTVRGTIRRVESLAPAENELGLQQFFRLTLRPPGRQIWPIIVYSLHLPAGFPHGDDVRADVTVSGYFFKNWSYAWSEGMGLAPVIMASGFDWQPPPMPEARRSALDSLPLVLLAGGGLALCCITVVFWHVRRVTPAGGGAGRRFSVGGSHAWKPPRSESPQGFDARHVAEQLEREP